MAKKRVTRQNSAAGRTAQKSVIESIRARKKAKGDRSDKGRK